MPPSKKNVEEWIGEIMKKEKVSQYEIVMDGGTDKGDGYLGEIAFVSVQTDGGKNDYVIKTAKAGEELRKLTPIREAYEREAFMYTKVLPMLQQFQEEHLIDDPFRNFPKHYFVSVEENKETLILKNIKSLGYEIHDRTKVMDFNHAALVFKNYAKLHGTSLALKKKKPAVWKSLTGGMTNVMAKFFSSGIWNDSLKRDINNVKQIWEKEGRKNLVIKLKGFEDKFVDYATASIDPEDPASVIIHGDCWNNNMMFKYCNQKPYTVALLDFQLSSVNSPVIDLSYYLYSCTDNQVLKNFDLLLKIYHDSLRNVLEDFSCEVEDFLTLEDLKRHWKEFGTFGLVMSLILIRATLAESTEAPDLAEFATNGDLAESFSFAIKNQDEYNRRIGEVFSHYTENFL